ncbi:MAG: amidohydrolase family protein [Planctomycetota bacterium]|nr:amidohydrolase family protein [Planctomycetota bacterium]
MNEPSPLPVLDVHTHLAGIGQGNSGCFIAPKKFDSLLYKLMRKKMGIYDAHKQGVLDEAYRARLEKDVATAAEHGALHAAVVFAHERIYTDAGEIAPTGQEMYVPNEHLFDSCERARGRFVPAMSVHPYRKDALDECHKWIERGAGALKWLPNSQGMDPRDKRCAPVFDLLAAKKVPLIAHTGGEHTVSIIKPELGDPEVLRPALDRGVTVIMAHCGTASGIFDTHWMPDFCKLARAYPNCYGDNSAFTTPGRARWSARILREEGVVEKLVHGSDYPVPPNAWWSFFSLGWSRTREIQRIWSFLERDVRIKQSLGFPEVVFTNAARLLAPGSLEKWGIRGSSR